MMNSSKTKRIGSWLLTLVLLAALFSVLGISALADETPVVTVSIENVKKENDTVTADVMVGAASEGIAGGQIYIDVPDGLELTGISIRNDIGEKGALVKSNKNNGFIGFALDSDEDRVYAWAGDGKLATLTFNVKDDAYGKQTIGIKQTSGIKDSYGNEAKTMMCYQIGETSSSPKEYAVTTVSAVLQLDSRLAFDVGGKGTAPAAVTGATDTDITVKPAAVEGWDFKGWYTDKNYTTEITTMPDGDNTAYAKWEKQIYTIMLDADGGTLDNGKESVSVTYGNKYPELPVPTREGFDFVGWFCGDSKVKQGEALAQNADHTLTAHWEEKGVITLDETPQSFTYGEGNIAFAVRAAGTSEIPEANTFTVEYKMGDEWTTVAPDNAGSCDVKISRAEDNDWKAYETTIKGGLVIDKKAVAAPEKDATIFTYDGSEQTYTVAGSTLYNVSGNKQTNAGDYKVTITLTNKVNYKWSTTDSSDDLSYDFAIAPQTVDEPAEDTKTFTYDGNEQTYTVASSTLYNVSGNKQTNAGTYSVKIELNDKTNCVWKTSGKSDDLSYKFVIAKAAQTAPTGITATAETISGKADGKLNGLTTAMEYSLDGKTWTKVTGTSAEKLAAGEYQIRLAETDNCDASPVTKVTVEAGAKLVVSFDANGGTIAAADTKQELGWQGTVTAPKVTKTGYDLAGWYKDGTLWDFAKDKVEENMTLTAGWKYALAATTDKFTVGNASNGLTISVAKGLQDLKLTKANLAAVYVGTDKLDAANYTVDDSEGLAVTLTKDYLNTLRVGKYDIQIFLQNSDDATLDRVAMRDLIVTLTVEEKPADTATPAPTATATTTKSPVKTGDSSNVLLWCVLVIGCGAAVTGVVLWDRKRRNN